MSLEQLAYLAEIIGGLVVAVSLILLVVQLRQNTLAVESAANQAFTHQIFEVNNMLDSALLEIMYRAEGDPASLTPVEIARIGVFWTSAYQSWQNLYYLVRAGVMDEARAAGWWQDLRQMFEFSVARAAWDRRGYQMSREFREFVKREVLTLEPLQDVSVFETNLNGW